MVHPYLKRRQGQEPVVYPHPSLEPILARTLGVPLFQEQLLRMAMVAAGFSGGEAEELRRAFGFKRSEKRMQQIEGKLRAGMARQGITGEPAEEIIRSITSFALYGFPESHAASFALLVYASAYLKAHYPAAFYTALLNNQPMGFYHPATLVKDAQRHGVRFAPIDVQESDWDCRVEPDGRVRLGLMYVNGLRAEVGKRIAESSRDRRIADWRIGSAAAAPSANARVAAINADDDAESPRCPKCGYDDPIDARRRRPTHDVFCNVCAHEWGRVKAGPLGADRSRQPATNAPRPAFDRSTSSPKPAEPRELATLARRSAPTLGRIDYGSVDDLIAEPASAATRSRRWPRSARSTRSATIAAARSGRLNRPCDRRVRCSRKPRRERPTRPCPPCAP